MSQISQAKEALQRGRNKQAEQYFLQAYNSNPENPQVKEFQPIINQALGYDVVNEQLCFKIKQKTDYYDILGVGKQANEDEVKKQYKKLALKVHPDKSKGPSASEAFKKVGQAFAVLTDKEKRERYDKFGHEEGPQNQRSGTYYYSDFEEIDPNEIFNMFFGMNPFFGGMGRVYTQQGRRNVRTRRENGNQNGVHGNVRTINMA